MSNVGLDSRQVDMCLANELVEFWNNAKLFHKPRDDKETGKLPLFVQSREIVQQRDAAQAMRNDTSISIWAADIAAYCLNPLIERRRIRFWQRNGMNSVLPIGGQALLEPREPMAIRTGLVSMNDVEVGLRVKKCVWKRGFLGSDL